MTETAALVTREPRSMPTNADTAEVLLATFVEAFRRLDVEAMLDCFAPDATAFFPVQREPRRLEGKSAISQAFVAVLERARTRGVGLTLEPTDIVVHEWGDTAVVTLHLRGDFLGRRTFVLRRQDMRWLIVHLHASTAPGKADKARA